MYYLLFKKQWTRAENDSIIAQRLLGLALVAGLLFLFIGCILSAMNEVHLMSLTVQLGERFTE